MNIIIFSYVIRILIISTNFQIDYYQYSNYEKRKNGKKREKVEINESSNSEVAL